MKSNNDKRIQEALDKKNFQFDSSDDAEYTVYSNLYEILGQSPEFSLPENFAEKVVLKIEKRKRFKDLTLLCGAVALAFAIFSIATFILLTYFPAIAINLKSILEFKWLILFALFLVFTVQTMDWFLVKRKKMLV
jgi:hypothetical protein